MSWMRAITQYLLDHPDATEVYLTEAIREEFRAEQGGRIEYPYERLTHDSARAIPLVDVYDLAVRYRTECMYPRGFGTGRNDIPYPHALDGMGWDAEPERDQLSCQTPPVEHTDMYPTDMYADSTDDELINHARHHNARGLPFYYIPLVSFHPDDPDTAQVDFLTPDKPVVTRFNARARHPIWL